MNFFKITFGFMSVFSMISAAFAVTARPGIVNTASVISASGRRMPSMNQMLTASSTTTGAVAVAPASTVTMDEVECVEAYTECLSDSESCGAGFEECTTNVLFHAQMPDCTSTLMQCPASAIVKLFGSGAGITNLSNVAEYNDDNEIIRYTYPMAGTILDQKIEAARIENMYDDQTCIKRYTNCLKRDDVCGEYFELCTSNNSFKKQALNCDSHLARCQMSGVRKMFGDNVKNKSMNKADGLFEGAVTVDDVKTIGGSIAVLIDEGLDHVAMNAVSSCYKKIDACILAACDKNPLRCIEGTSLAAISEAENVGEVAGSSDFKSDFKTIIKAGETEEKLTISHINRYLRSECADAIGGFEACHITYMGAKPKAKDLKDRDIIEEVFNLAHNDRKSILTSKIQGRMQEFDTAAKDACRETIRTCAMRTCGGGIGSACYSLVYGGTSAPKTINAGDTYNDIKNACSAIVNTDKNCVYAYTYRANDATDYSYSYIDDDAFNTLFPEETGTDGYQSKNDPIGVIGELNSLLATSYNDAAIAQMKKECTNAAKGCVKALCGSEYESCYRNRTDIMSNITDTGDPSFDKSMNKVGGVLDYTVIVGLCLDTVKNNNSCHEHLAITKARFKSEFDAGTSTWGSAGKDGGVRGGWMDAGRASKVSAETEQIAARDENGNELCRNDEGEEGVCNESSCSDTKCIYDEPVMQSYTTYVESQADSTFFRDLVYDLEKEAQAKYNAKLTKLQNSCLASNGGNGIMGAGDMSSIYKWAKLKGKLPADYANSGLKESNFTASNDLYGSFCAVKVTLHSDDQVIRDALNGALKEKKEKMVEGTYTDGGTIDLKKDSYRYFAVGDPIVCGGWLTGAQLEQIASVVEANARAQAKDGEIKGMRGWMTALGAVGLGTGGVFAGDAIQNGGTLNLGLSGNKSSSKKKVSTLQKACNGLVDSATDSLSSGDSGTAKKHLLSAISKVEEYNDLSDKRRGEEVGVSAVRSKVRGMKTPDQLCADKSGEYKDNKCTVSGTPTPTPAPALVKSYITEEAKEVADLCDKMSEYDKEEGTVWDNHKGKILGGIIGAGAGAGLAYAVTDAVMDAKLDKAGNEAYQAFMDAIGSKIQCYIGTTEVGSYGQIIETSME